MPNWVFITYSMKFIGVYSEGDASNGNCYLQTSCRRLDWQLSFATQISNQLSPLLSGVHFLVLQKVRELPTGEEDVEPAQWLELFRPFTRVTGVYAATCTGHRAGFSHGGHGHRSITRAGLASSERVSQFPAKAAEQFVVTRRLSGRTVELFDGEESLDNP